MFIFFEVAYIFELCCLGWMAEIFVLFDDCGVFRFYFILFEFFELEIQTAELWVYDSA